MDGCTAATKLKRLTRLDLCLLEAWQPLDARPTSTTLGGLCFRACCASSTVKQTWFCRLCTKCPLYAPPSLFAFPGLFLVLSSFTSSSLYSITLLFNFLIINNSLIIFYFAAESSGPGKTFSNLSAYLSVVASKHTFNHYHNVTIKSLAVAQRNVCCRRRLCHRPTRRCTGEPQESHGRCLLCRIILSGTRQWLNTRING